MGKKPKRIIRRSEKASSYKPTTRKEPVRVYGEEESAEFGTDRMNITQQVIQHPAVRQSRADDSEETKYDQLFHTIYDAVFITSLDGSILEVNARAEHKFGLERAELCDRNILDLVSGADKRVLDVLGENVGQNKYTVLEAVCLRSDNSRFYAEIVVNQMMRKENRLFCFFIRDATGRKQAEQDLAAAQEKLLEAEKAQTALETVSAVTQELNDPLQILTCLAELDKRSDYLEQVERINSILNRIKREQTDEEKIEHKTAESSPVSSEPLRGCDSSRMLVVDDEEKIRQIFVEALKSAFPDVSVDEAGDGLEALYRFKDNHYGVILMDILLPELDGEEAFYKIREMCESEGRECPRFIFCTAFDVTDGLKEIVGDGRIHTWLKKPVTMAEIVDKAGERLNIGRDTGPGNPPGHDNGRGDEH
ncbi:MAG: PAS domain S-box protein [Kiritimatiellia bacterium]